VVLLQDPYSWYEEWKQIDSKKGDPFEKERNVSLSWDGLRKKTEGVIEDELNMKQDDEVGVEQIKDALQSKKRWLHKYLEW